MSIRIRIATRKSRLALWQAEHVAMSLRGPDVAIELIPMTTEGDRKLSSRLDLIGGKGLFIKELEIAIEEDRADLAVHSMKDVPVSLPGGFCIASVLERDDPTDAFVSNHFARLEDLPKGARLGTSSLRRQSQIRHLRPDLEIGLLRGNVETRLKRLDEDRFDAILLASAGLKRLGLSTRIRQKLDAEICLPAIGQGIIGIECRDDAFDLRELLASLEHAPSRRALDAERAVGRALQADCHAPIAAHACIEHEKVFVDALVATPEGTAVIRDREEGPVDEAQSVGVRLAERLLERGAARILETLRTEHG